MKSIYALGIWCLGMVIIEDCLGQIIPCSSDTPVLLSYDPYNYETEFGPNTPVFRLSVSTCNYGNNSNSRTPGNAPFTLQLPFRPPNCHGSPAFWKKNQKPLQLSTSYSRCYPDSECSRILKAILEMGCVV